MSFLTTNQSTINSTTIIDEALKEIRRFNDARTITTEVSSKDDKNPVSYVRMLGLLRHCEHYALIEVLHPSRGPISESFFIHIGNNEIQNMIDELDAEAQ